MKINRYIIALAILVFTQFSAQAQSKYIISGFVKDSITAEPLIGVVIHNSTIRDAVTNEAGFFSVTVDTTKPELNFTQIGYKTAIYQGNISGDTELNINLSPSVLMVGEVRVQTKNKFATGNALGVISVNSQQLKYVPSFLGEKDLFKYFQLLPGVQSGKEGSSGLNIRGGSTDQTLILMDDVPIYNSAHAFGFISIFSGDYIKSAELYKGYAPSRYGGRLSGVATMNIREGDRKKHSQSIQLGTTTFSALVEGPINGGKGSYLAGGRYFVPNLFLHALALSQPSDKASYPIMGFYDFTAKASYDITKSSTLYASFYTGNDAINLYSNEISSEPIVKTETKDALNWGNIVGSIRLKSKLSNRSFLNVTAYYSHLSNQKLSNFSNSTGEVNESSIESKMGEAGLKANVQTNINDWYKLDYGINLAYQNFIPQDIKQNRDGVIDDIQYGERDLYSGNIFLDNKFTLGSFNLNVGGRLSLYNNNKEQKTLFEPRTSLTYYMDNSSIWTSYVLNSQPLFSMNQHHASIPVDYWVPFQNANELPTSQQISLGYKHSFDFGLDISAETYYKKSKNISIITDTGDFLLEDGGYKIATGDAYGAEFLAQYSYGRFSAMAAYTYSKSLHNIGGETVNFIYDIPHDINLFSAYETVRTKDKTHTVSININYKSGTPYFLSDEVYDMEKPNADWFGALTNYPTYANTRLKNYFRVDLNYTMEKKLKRGSRIWQVSILNATAHRNPYLIYKKDNGYKAFQLIPFLPSFSYTRKF